MFKSRTLNVIRMGAVLTLPIGILLAFQNCDTAKMKTSAAEGHLRVHGNGTPYEGKIYASQARCSDGTAQAEIQFLSGEALLLRENCTPLNSPRKIPASEVTILSVTEITYAGQSFSLSDVWQPLNKAGAPEGRAKAIAYWTGQEMLVWGGQTAQADTNTGALYNPSTQSWRPISVAAATPQAQWGIASAWTGSELLLWGGSQFDGYGARYNPAANSWTAMSTVGAPSPRAYSASVWTGTELFVWGGETNLVAHNTGARYNPTTDTWTALPTAGAPAATTFYQPKAAVWTGTEVLIWGGSTTSGTALGRGARFNLTTNTWRSISSVGAPTPRYGMTLIWTGTELFVWGGTIGISMGDGALYNPATDSWRPISTVNAPSARDAYLAVKMGSNILIWSGNDSNMNNLQDGAIYNPAQNSWKTVSSIDSPLAAWTAVGVWTGSQALIWGGGQPPSGPYYDTGGAYSP